MNTLTLPLTRHLWGALVALLAFAGFLITAPAAHATPANGWIWGGGADNFEGAAWFSMNASNANDPASDGLYVVDIPFGDGDITGYAWSGGTAASSESFYGWLSFEEGMHSVASCGGKGNARRVGNTIVGAAIIVASAGSGGYDGCVVFNHGQAGKEVTIDPTTGNLSGYAYSSEYGWLEMSNVSIAASGAKAGTLTGFNCSIAEGASSCSPTLNWTVNEWVTGAELRDTSGPVHALVVPPVSGTFTVTPLADKASKTFGLYGRSLAAPGMDELQGGVTVTAFCNAPRVIADGVCKTPAATGDIKVYDVATNADVTASPDCTIPVNGTSCSRKVSWTSANATAPSIKRDGVTLSNSASGTLSPNPTFDGSGVPVTFAVFDGLSSLKTVQIKGVCETGSSWQTGAGKCELIVAPGGSISTSTCIVQIGQNNCNATISWTTNASVVNPMIYEKIETNPQVLKYWTKAGSFTVNLSMKADGTGERAVYELYNGATTTENRLAGPTTVTATCVSGAEYSPTTGKCEATGVGVTASVNGSSLCEIKAGTSTCEFVTLGWEISGSFEKATVKAVRKVDSSFIGYAPSGDMEWGSYPFSANISSADAHFNNVVGFDVSGAVEFQVVYWVPGNPNPIPAGSPFPVMGSCATGSTWDVPSGKCKSDVVEPSGTLTVVPKYGTSCENLEDGSSQCPVTVKWNTENATPPFTLERSLDGGAWTTISSGALDNADGELDNNLTAPGTYTYRLSVNARALAQASITMSCENDWNSDATQCVGVKYARIYTVASAELCKVPLDESECTMAANTIEWAVAFTNSPVLYMTNTEVTNEVVDSNDEAVISVDWSNKQIATQTTLRYGANTFSVKDSAGDPVQFDTDGNGEPDADTHSFNVICASPGQWNHVEGKCRTGGPQ